MGVWENRGELEYGSMGEYWGEEYGGIEEYGNNGSTEDWSMEEDWSPEGNGSMEEDWSTEKDGNMEDEGSMGWGRGWAGIRIKYLRRLYGRTRLPYRRWREVQKERSI
jgi:hypothetical protein